MLADKCEVHNVYDEICLIVEGPRVSCVSQSQPSLHWVPRYCHHISRIHRRLNEDHLAQSRLTALRVNACSQKDVKGLIY